MADDLIASARSMTAVTNNQYQTIGLPQNALTPATLTAMAGFHQGGGLKVPDSVTSIIGSLQSSAFSLTSSIPTLASAISGLGVTAANLTPSILSNVVSTITGNANISTGIKDSITSLTAPGGPLASALGAASDLSTLTSKLLPAGNPAAFGKFMMQAQAHISDSIDIKKAISCINTRNLSDYGSGVTDMASMTDRGITNTLGSLTGAAAAMTGAAKLFNTKNMDTYGTPAGFIEQMRANKLANATELNQKLEAAGVTDPNDPAQADKVYEVLASINDPKILNVVTDQMDVNPFAGLPSAPGDNSLNYGPTMLTGGATDTLISTTSIEGATSTASTAIGAAQAPAVGAGGIQSLKDLLDVDKVTDPSATSGLKGGFTGIANKFKDIGASFPSSSAASNILGSVKMPSIPNLDSTVKGLIPDASSLVEGAKGQLSGLMSSVTSTLNDMTGKGAGTLGVPSLKDIMGPITGQCVEMEAARLNPTPETAAAVSAAVSRTTAFFLTAGIDLDVPAPKSFASAMSFATNLHKMGADANGFGTSSMLSVMATDDQYGDAVKASLAEGENNAVLAEAGVAPVKSDEPTDYTIEYNKLEKKVAALQKEYYSTNRTATKLEKQKKILALQYEMKSQIDQFANDPEFSEIIDQVIAGSEELIAQLQLNLNAGIATS